MPIPAHTKLTAVPGMLAANIKTYNDTHAGYNRPYANHIAARNDGTADAGSLSGAWIAGNGATPIQTLLKAFGMNARTSRLVAHNAFQGVLSDLNPGQSLVGEDKIDNRINMSGSYRGKRKMKIVSLLACPRKQGNSSAVAKHFCKAAEDIGAAVRAFALNELHYRGCQA